MDDSAENELFFLKVQEHLGILQPNLMSRALRVFFYAQCFFIKGFCYGANGAKIPGMQ